jgi:hypothetical protein
MTKQDIINLFNKQLHKRGVFSKVPGLTKDVIYDWRTGRTTAPFGDMLYVLYELNLIEIHGKPTSPTPEQ